MQLEKEDNQQSNLNSKYLSVTLVLKYSDSFINLILRYEASKIHKKRIRDSSGVFSIASLVMILMGSFPTYRANLCNSLVFWPIISFISSCHSAMC